LNTDALYPSRSELRGITFKNKTQGFKDDMKERSHIEPKQSEMKLLHGLARAKYWGLPKVNIQSIIAGITVNVKRLANIIGSVSC
jgi:transposase